MTGAGTAPFAHVEVILYVADQSRARDFYAALLGREPSLDVSGMTEFPLGPGSTLGLMPSDGIARLISPPLPHPTTGAGIPRCELYLRVDDAADLYSRALDAGASAVSPLAARDWGDDVAYAADPDGHVLAFAQPSSAP